MTFLIVFICCAAELTYMSSQAFRATQWIVSWHRWLTDKIQWRGWRGGGALVAALVLPCFVLAALFNIVVAESTLMSLVGGSAVLLFCFGSGDIAGDIESYTSHYLDANDQLSLPDKENFLQDVGSIDGDPDGPTMRAVAIEANDSLFAPALWFCILGPVGALLFRMSSTLQRSLDDATAEAVLARRLYDVLLWLPARLLGFGLGLAGTLGPVMGVLRDRAYDLSESNTLLGDAALAALGHQAVDDYDGDDSHVASIRSMFRLVKHGFIVWLVVLGLLSSAGLA